MERIQGIESGIGIKRGVMLDIHDDIDCAYLSLPRKRYYVDYSKEVNPKTIVDLGVFGVEFLGISNGVHIASLPLTDNLKRTLSMVFSQIGITVFPSSEKIS
ncbi:MAG: hypothetical protein ACD_30C00040G0011 [uncultured bacterium]|uniref:Uncharacterized protein n=4 Tax=Candidatus Daviesiibacteriota TaxID=1752718 RepID=A0A0G0F9K0_9BACT|nr:MAG: hypothetical protein ACD_30C00040G0011 [uncultured bacterium]KKQ10185.1 MAG: hypothetical protein US19_C0008G0028 [Candidatus Daviesbacteria bacterium GW2011_GWB1_36_5]KKQ15067.1 MAG: hypothetical protein US28_C0024G0024 [Candidatus Daviesbacteria bacterium GW2011_GWA1_36_8]OGE17138.1 MAG: hypothetical protein A2858_00335 [Candidatus Daviesbacteria bacterium RIFCSPHIGHO2_01_FULL_36_37]OGE35919.1 MAG: hypothetical protein A3E66_01330 [Candidatus Daviesbacteria bacterium RIFCSPHIGHO2_12_F